MLPLLIRRFSAAPDESDRRSSGVSCVLTFIYSPPVPVFPVSFALPEALCAGFLPPPGKTCGFPDLFGNFTVRHDLLSYFFWYNR